MCCHPSLVVFPASVPSSAYGRELDRLMSRAKGVKARGFSDAKSAERYARRSGVGAEICEALAGLPLVATIVASSAHRTGVVTQVTWEGWRFL